MNSGKRIVVFAFLIFVAITVLFYVPLNIFSENHSTNIFSKSRDTAQEPSEVITVFPDETPTSPEPSDGKQKPSFYKKLLNDKKELGFTPSVNLWNKVSGRIKGYYVNDVPSSLLYRGTKKEIKTLLNEAGIDGKQLEEIPENDEILNKTIEIYKDRVDPDLIIYAGIKGLIRALEDQYTEFMTPTEYSNFLKKIREEQYGGIGIRISKVDKNAPLLIVEVFDSSPAKEAGLKRGDKIVKVDGEDIVNTDLKIIADKITGKENTTVKISVERESKILEFEVTRKRIQVKVVHYRMLGDNIGYIKIDSFKDELDNEFRNAYKDLEKKGMKALVLDMRNNPGGLVISAQELCGAFLTRDSLVSQFRHRNNEQRKIYSIGRQIVFVPVALLVNKHSASSAEIVSAALKDHGAATLIGTTTRGKGSVQRTNEMEGGSALKMTIEKIFSPNGIGINKTGIQPDIEAPMELEKIGTKDDSQLEKAKEFLKGKISGEK